MKARDWGAGGIQSWGMEVTCPLLQAIVYHWSRGHSQVKLERRQLMFDSSSMAPTHCICTSVMNGDTTVLRIKYAGSSKAWSAGTIAVGTGEHTVERC